MAIITAQIKAAFFDRPKVMAAVDAARRRVLSRAGGTLRLTARRSMRAPRKRKPSDLDHDARKAYDAKLAERRAKGQPKPDLGSMPSAPGEPPRSPTRLLKTSIFYAYDQVRKTVVVGPTKKHSDAPRVLEEGGSILIGPVSARRRVKIEARPYMGPALATTVAGGQMAELWRNSIR